MANGEIKRGCTLSAREGSQMYNGISALLNASRQSWSSRSKEGYNLHFYCSKNTTCTRVILLFAFSALESMSSRQNQPLISVRTYFYNVCDLRCALREGFGSLIYPRASRCLINQIPFQLQFAGVGGTAPHY